MPQTIETVALPTSATPSPQQNILSANNDLVLRALRRQPVSRTPIWLMRQAGRYLPEYRAVRGKVPDFMSLCRTPELACEVALQPLRRYPLDAAILFSDILTIPAAMGLEVHFPKSGGPKIAPVRNEDDVRRLAAPDPTEKLRYVIDAVSLTRQALGGKVPLIGFAGSPWTLACYMVEGQGNRDFHQVRKMRHQRPDLLSQIIRVNTKAVTDYLLAQLDAGAQVVMLFDSWGGILSTRDYETFSLNPMRQIIDDLKKRRKNSELLSIVFTKGCGIWLEKIAEIGCSAVGLDWQVDVAYAKEKIGNRSALQGNLDPMALMASPEEIVAQAHQILSDFNGDNGHIFNLGHGILPFTPLESVSALVEAVQTFPLKHAAI